MTLPSMRASGMVSRTQSKNGSLVICFSPFGYAASRRIACTPARARRRRRRAACRRIPRIATKKPVGARSLSEECSRAASGGNTASAAPFFVSAPAMLFGVASSAEALAVEQASVGPMTAMMEFEAAFIAASLAPVLTADQGFGAHHAAELPSTDDCVHRLLLSAPFSRPRRAAFAPSFLDRRQWHGRTYAPCRR
jgi:hypothetical protein